MEHLLATSKCSIPKNVFKKQFMWFWARVKLSRTLLKSQVFLIKAWMETYFGCLKYISRPPNPCNNVPSSKVPHRVE